MSVSDDFHAQNQFIQDLIDKYSTNDTKNVYLTEQISFLININWWLFLIFIIVAIIFSVFCILSPKMKKWSYVFKIIIVLFVLCYPFYIYHVEKYAMITYVYIKDMIMGNPYVAPDF